MNLPPTNAIEEIAVGLAWCLAWGSDREPQSSPEALKAFRQAIGGQGSVSGEIAKTLAALQAILRASSPKEELQKYPDLLQGDTSIGLVYGGATKIKQYVFESDKLSGIRGASALLDRINLIDLPAFFGCERSDFYPQCQKAAEFCQSIRHDWLHASFPGLADALIPELIVYSTGGNILAFCPSAYIHDLANAIERRYTEETLTANSCAVGNQYTLKQLFAGLRETALTFSSAEAKHLLGANFAKLNGTLEEFSETARKSQGFNQITTQLAIGFNRRRSGNDGGDNRPPRCYPPMFETHPYLRRDGSDRRAAILQAERLPNQPHFSEAAARQYLTGQLAKRDDANAAWYPVRDLMWLPDRSPHSDRPQQRVLQSWVNKFEEFLEDRPELRQKYLASSGTEETHSRQEIGEARSLREIGNASDGFVAFIYADGNNMGGYIQNIATPSDYRQFSLDISQVTEEAAYKALAHHLRPHKLKGLKNKEDRHREGKVIHPFEIITIGGDDVFLIVPADKALDIAHTLCLEFEEQLLRRGDRYVSDTSYDRERVHRYRHSELNIPIAPDRQCELSMSAGVLIAAEDMPIYYAENLVSQLLKSAKKKAKDLKKSKYLGGTIDFLVMKSITAISSSISAFRQNALTREQPQKLKLYGGPYTLYELQGLLRTAQALKRAKFPRSQLYEIRSLLDGGKQTAMLNYRYFRVRLSDKHAQQQVHQEFEEAWCQPKDPKNMGNLAPWMTVVLQDDKDETHDKKQPEHTAKNINGKSAKDEEKTTYETIWRDVVDLYPFLPDPDRDKPGTSDRADTSNTQPAASQEVSS